MDQSVSEDLVEAFDELLNYFGRTVIYRPANGDPDIDTTAIFGDSQFGGRQSQLEAEYDRHLADRTVVYISDTTVPTPQANDKIIYGADTYRVVKASKMDPGQHWELYVSKSVRARR